MMKNPVTEQLKSEMLDELLGNILPFWSRTMRDHERGGFYGTVDGHDVLHPTDAKGAILNARILWAFSAAYRVLLEQHAAPEVLHEVLSTAKEAKGYLLAHFYDRENGGVYWSVDADGLPLDTKKQSYAIGFAIYGLSEYARATGDEEARQYAVRLYDALENHCLDPLYGGYTEAMSRTWHPIADMRLSEKDENGAKTMNTHLHIIEPYTNLYRIWPDVGLRRQLENLLHLFVDVMLNKETSHLDLFFDRQWNGRRNLQSFGHDIEASWLLHETALLLGDAEMLARTEPLVRKMAAAADEGLLPNGAMAYERYLDDGRTDNELHWWVQCENVVGHCNLYQHFDDEQALDVAARCWQFIRSNLVDRQHGEWHWSLTADGTVNLHDDKAGFWKCPYHNARMCLEIIERFR